MAYTKKTSTKTVGSKVNSVSENNNTVKEETVIEPRVFEPTDLIPCRSIVSGPLYIEGARTKALYSWADYDDVQDVEYQDLIYMVRSRDNVNIYYPRIIVLDEEFIAQSKALTDLYNSMYTTVDLRDIIKLPIRRMIEEVEKLPNGAKESLKGIVSTMIDGHELDSVQKIKALDEIFGTKNLLTLAQE